MKMNMAKFFTTMTLLLMTHWATAQISCSELTDYVKTEGDKLRTYCCFDSEFLTNVDFYSLDIDGDDYYFALVKIDYYKEYIYCVPYSTISNFAMYAFTDQAGEAFHSYIRDYKCNCH